MAKFFQPNLSGGIVSEGMYARSDTSKYNVGVKDALNMLIRAQGGMQNRAGTMLASGFDTSTEAGYQWNIPFQFNSDDSYILEFSDEVFRVLRNGAYVLDTATAPQTVDAVTTAATAQLTMADAAAAAVFAVGDLVYLQDPSGSHTLHQQTLKVTGVTGAAIDFVVYDSTTLDTSSGASVWGAIGPTATLSKVYGQFSPYSVTDLPKVKYAQDADTLFLAHPSHPPQRIQRAGDDDWVMAPVVFAPETPAPANFTVTQVKPNAGSDQTLWYAVAAINGETLEESLPTAEVQQNNALQVSGNVNNLAWDAVPDATLYVIYKRRNDNVLGLMGVTAELSFVDDNITPDKATNPKTARDPFVGAGNFPSAVTFVEQRLTWAATNNDPQRVEMSRTDNLYNYTVSFPSRDDDALRFRLRSAQLNRINALVPARALIAFTGTAEWLITGNENEGILKPSSIVAKPETYWGAFDIQPLLVGDVAMFIEQSGNTVRDYKLDAQDPSQDLTIAARDLFSDKTVTSWTYTQHPDRAIWVTLDTGELLSLVYMREHDVWGWTRHQLGGDESYARQVVSVREGTRDVLYITVERVVNGTLVVMTERMVRRRDDDVRRAFFVDAGLTYDGSPAAALTGLLHLRGETVTLLADGDVLLDIVVDEAGRVTLGDKTASIVHVGLPYTCHVQTLDVDFEADEIGSMQGRFKAASEVAILLSKSRGVSAGIGFDDQNELDEWTPEMVGGPIPLFTKTINIQVDGDWLRNANIVVAQRNPLPFTLLGIAPDWETGE